MPYQVFENNIPADNTHYLLIKDKGWHTSRFETFHEALDYARNWFQPYLNYWDGLGIKDYNGYGDTAEIREVK